MSATKKGSTAWMRHLIPQDRIWRLVDAKGQVLGRIAVQIAQLLRGKHKPYNLDNMNCGDPVVVINARRAVLLGRKSVNKVYIHHSGYPGGLKRVPIEEVMRKRPEHPLRRAVYNMLPRNRLRKVWMANLHVFMEDDHPFKAQNPALVGPAHVNLHIKKGGSPSFQELSHWWTQNLLQLRESEIASIIADVRATRKRPSKSRGFADLLPGDGDSSSKAAAMSNYIAAAERALQEDAVIVPETLT